VYVRPDISPDINVREGQDYFYTQTAVLQFVDSAEKPARGKQSKTAQRKRPHAKIGQGEVSTSAAASSNSRAQNTKKRKQADAPNWDLYWTLMAENGWTKKGKFYCSKDGKEYPTKQAAVRSVQTLLQGTSEVEIAESDEMEGREEDGEDGEEGGEDGEEGGEEDAQDKQYEQLSTHSSVTMGRMDIDEMSDAAQLLEWRPLWGRLQLLGWKLENNEYVSPMVIVGRTHDGTYQKGKDYFTSNDDLSEYIQANNYELLSKNFYNVGCNVEKRIDFDHYVDDGALQQKAPASRSKTPSKQSKKAKQPKSSKSASAAASATSTAPSGPKISQRRRNERVSTPEKEAQRLKKTETERVWKEQWPMLKSVGWKWVSHTTALSSGYIFVRPGKSGGKNKKEGEDYIVEKCDVLSDAEAIKAVAAVQQQQQDEEEEEEEEEEEDEDEEEEEEEEDSMEVDQDAGEDTHGGDEGEEIMCFPQSQAYGGLGGGHDDDDDDEDNDDEDDEGDDSGFKAGGAGGNGDGDDDEDESYDQMDNMQKETAAASGEQPPGSVEKKSMAFGASQSYGHSADVDDDEACSSQGSQGSQGSQSSARSSSRKRSPFQRFEAIGSAEAEKKLKEEAKEAAKAKSNPPMQQRKKAPKANSKPGASAKISQRRRNERVGTPEKEAQRLKKDETERAWKEQWPMLKTAGWKWVSHNTAFTSGYIFVRPGKSGGKNKKEGEDYIVEKCDVLSDAEAIKAVAAVQQQEKKSKKKTGAKSKAKAKAKAKADVEMTSADEEEEDEEEEQEQQQEEQEQEEEQEEQEEQEEKEKEKEQAVKATEHTTTADDAMDVDGAVEEEEQDDEDDEDEEDEDEDEASTEPVEPNALVLPPVGVDARAVVNAAVSIDTDVSSEDAYAKTIRALHPSTLNSQVVLRQTEQQLVRAFINRACSSNTAANASTAGGGGNSSSAGQRSQAGRERQVPTGASLYLAGGPGTGKTALMKSIVDTLEAGTSVASSLKSKTRPRVLWLNAMPLEQPRQQLFQRVLQVR
jgi:hypothetical protein